VVICNRWKLSSVKAAAQQGSLWLGILTVVSEVIWAGNLTHRGLADKKQSRFKTGNTPSTLS
jgi:CRISPR/Cas system-associated protein Csm6